MEVAVPAQDSVGAATPKAARNENQIFRCASY